MRYSAMRFILPFCLFLVLTGFLWKGLSLDPKELPSVLIGQPSPPFNLATVEDPNRFVTEGIFKGHFTILNVWATWCISCKAEHGVWVDLAREPKRLSDLFIIGLNYHDTLAEAKRWLQRDDSPYHLTIFDEDGRLGINYGVYGTPETFILDKEGVIRYRHVGPIDHEIWKNKLLPIIEGLKKSG